MWMVLGRLGGSLESLWGPLESFLVHLGVLLCWPVSEAPWASLERLLGRLGGLLGTLVTHFGPSLEVLGASWKPLGHLLTRFGNLMELPGEPEPTK